MAQQHERAVRQVLLRMITPMIFLLFLSSLDRVNVSFAALRMNADIGLSAAAYATGVSIFFVGYLLFQAPSLWLLDRIGARLWIGICVVGWGLVATAMAFIQDATQFYVLRVLLGIFEAGFGPGSAYCCTRWVPRRYLTGAISKTTLAIPISVIIGGPLSTSLMTWGAASQFDGWRVMFFIEGAVTVLMGLFAFWWFIDRPGQAKWLSQDEKDWLEGEIAADRAAVEKRKDAVPLKRLISSPRVWGAAFTWFSTLVGAYGMIYWLPLVVKELSGVSDLSVGFLTAIPWIGVGAGMLTGGAISDRRDERYWSVAVPAFLAGLAMAAAAFSGGGLLALMTLTLAGFCFGAAQGAFWGVPTGFLTGGALTAGVALINTIGSTGGLVGPKAFGWIREATGGFTAPVLAMAALLILGAVTVIAIRPKAEPIPAPGP
jgi:MFS family permease